MAILFSDLNFSLLICLLMPFIMILTETHSCKAQIISTAPPQTVTVAINGRTTIAKIGDNFLCATLDWWPPEKCDYGTCSWGRASALNLDLSNPLLQNAVRGLTPLMLRLGGSLQDKLIYGIGNLQRPCVPQKPTSDLFGFSEGCLNMSRWDALNRFFQLTGVQVAFGLNALYGREKDYTHAWDSTNAYDFIQYTIKKKYQIQAWELGNELSGSGVGASVPVSQYVSDVKKLRAVIDQLYAGWTTKPLIVAPDGFFDENWYLQLLQGTGNQIINVLSRHIYSLGAGVDTDLVDKILNPSYLSQEAGPYRSMQQMLQTNGPWAQAWIGEAGGAYNSGHHLVTDAFVFSFWYADQLGMAARFNNTAFCRQSLIGGNYGLLDHATFNPNPDYYSALIWKTLMGKNVLSASVNGNNYLRAYAHCSKGDSQSISVLLINLSNTTQFSVNLAITATAPLDTLVRQFEVPMLEQKTSGTSKSGAQRLEYHLTAPNGDLHSQTVLLNGVPLQMTSSGNLPTLNPILVNPSLPISVAPLSIVFVKVPHLPNLACT
ncbi:hypothetical protein O6H91_14G047700 [Diphasiastrum complanatum]|uniref:Uncharacterized protein n=1 Tax=Diphasiastrum complanatum TaxID=34168 RepID=A0ACC2BP50_DIPCM|nr:hypothetical protein O6H91_14G047700 [Diphasiastrum complanatum]